MSFPFSHAVVIEAPTQYYALTNFMTLLWYVPINSSVSININLNPSPINDDQISWTFTPSNNNSLLSKVVDITESLVTTLFSLASDHLSLMIPSLTPDEEGNYTITVLDNLVNSTKTISLNILREQFVSCVWCSGFCLLLLSSVHF